MNRYQEIEDHTSKWAQKHPKMTPSRGAHGMENHFQCIDRQSNTKNICTKFHEKILSESQEIEGHTPKWVQKEPAMAQPEKNMT